MLIFIKLYLLEYKKCKIQYVGKTETPLNIRLNNDRSDANNPTEDTIPAAKHLSKTTFSTKTPSLS